MTERSYKGQSTTTPLIITMFGKNKNTDNTQDQKVFALQNENEMLKKQIKILTDANKKYASMAKDYTDVLDKLHQEEKECHELLTYLQMVKKDINEIIGRIKSEEVDNDTENKSDEQ